MMHKSIIADVVPRVIVTPEVAIAVTLVEVWRSFFLKISSATI